MNESEKEDKLPELETPCSYCGGNGVSQEDGALEMCPMCHGAKFETTEMGEKILRLLRHNLKHLLNQMGD